MEPNLFSSYKNSVPAALLKHIDSEVNGFVMMDYNYQSSRFLNASLDPFLHVPASNTLGFRAGLRHPTTSWEASVWVRNVTDEDVWAIGFDVPTLRGYAAFQLPPRTIGGTLRLKF